MKKPVDRNDAHELLPEYDFRAMKKGVRGKYAKKYREGTNLVLLSPDVAPYFPDEKSVNSALRSLVDIAKAELQHAHQA